jgi:hypothetical protein
MDAEVPLAGGNMGPVTRSGDEVRRVAGPWTANVHRLLRLYGEAGITEVPRPLGFTDDGRERLSYLAGDVPGYPMPEWVWSESVLVDAARLLRRLHDVSGPLAGVSDGWRSPVRQPAEVVCHNDFAPYNLVFADGRLVGVIDFDYCSPGPRIWDLAYLAYRLAPLTGPQEPGGPATDAERAARLTRLIEAYGLAASPAELVAVAVERLLALARFSDDAATTLGNPELHDHAAGYRADAAGLAAWQVPFAGSLTGGNPRGLSGVRGVLADLGRAPERLDELVGACTSPDAIVRMRAADALEKFARTQPDLVAARLDRLHDVLGSTDQPSLRWHLAQLYGQLPLTPAQAGRAAAWLADQLDHATDWIVLNCCLDALAVLTRRDPALSPVLRLRLDRHAGSSLASVATRAQRLRQEFGS